MLGRKRQPRCPKSMRTGKTCDTNMPKVSQSNVSIKRRNGNGEQDMTRGRVQWLQCTIPFSPQTESLHETTLQRCNTVVYTYIPRLALYHNTRSHCASWRIIPGGTVTRHSQVKVLSGFSEKLRMFEMNTAHEAMRKICEFHQGVTSFALFGRGRLSWQLLVRLTDQYLAGLATDFLRLPNIFTDAPWLECLSSCQQCE